VAHATRLNGHDGFANARVGNDNCFDRDRLTFAAGDYATHALTSQSIHHR